MYIQDFAKKFYAIADPRQITRQMVADRAGIGRHELAQMCKGKGASVSSLQLRCICQILNVPENYFTGKETVSKSFVQDYSGCQELPPNITGQKLDKWLEPVLRARKMSKKDLAQLMPFSVNYVYNILSGAQRLSGNFYAQLCKVLHLPESYFLEQSEKSGEVLEQDTIEHGIAQPIISVCDTAPQDNADLIVETIDLPVIAQKQKIIDQNVSLHEDQKAWLAAQLCFYIRKWDVSPEKKTPDYWLQRVNEEIT